MLILSRSVDGLTDTGALASHLARIGGFDVTMSADPGARAIIAARGDAGMRALAAERGILLVELRESWTGRGLGLGLAEFGAGPHGKTDMRPARLAAAWGRRLTDGLVQAAASEVCLPATDDEGPGAAETDEALWRALARGAEVTFGEPGFAAALGLANGAAVGSDGPDRPLRDRARIALATEYLFNVFPDDAEVIAAGLVEAVRAHVPPLAPKVSIIVTAFNYGAFVADAVMSAMRQTRVPHEVIVVDDGSTDDTPGILSGIAGIRVIRKQNGGQASAFNAGFAASTGDVILFLDGDDRLAPDAVERISEIDWFGISRAQFLLETVDRHGQPTGLHAACHRAAAGDLRGALRADGVFWFMPTSGNAFPRRTLEALLPMPEQGFEIAADLFLVLGAALVGGTHHVDRVLGQYRVHGRNAYFHARAGAIYLKERRRAQRLRAWAALLENVGELASEEDRVAVETDLRRLVREAPRDKPPDPATDPVGAAGKAQWPTLDTGDDRSFLSPEAGASVLGAGWSDAGSRGTFPRSATTHLAFRLPAQVSDWTATLRVRLEGPPLRRVAFLLNGHGVDCLDIFGSGEIELALPHLLLPLDGTGNRPALLTMEFEDMPGDAFGLLGFRVDRTHGTGGPAPAPAEAEWHPLTAGSRLAGALWSGWHWPDATGVRPSGTRARIALSFVRAEDRLLLLDWDGPGTPLVYCSAGPLDASRSAGGGCCTVALPATAGVSPKLDLVFPEIGADTRLRALSWVGTPAGSPPIGVYEPIQDLIEARSGGLSCMALTPAGASPLGPRAHVRLPRPRLPEGGFLVLDFRRVSDPAAPLGCRARLDGRSCRLTVGAMSRLRLPLEHDDSSGELMLELSVDGDPGDLVLASACFDAAAPRQAADRLAEGAALDLPGLLALAPFWHTTSDGGAWLGAPVAELVLPELPRGTKALMTRTLTLDAPFDQRLEVSLLDECGEILDLAESSPGIGEVRLAVPEDVRSGLCIRVRTDHLVSSDLVGAEAGPMLGGAVLSVSAG